MALKNAGTNRRRVNLEEMLERARRLYGKGFEQEVYGIWYMVYDTWYMVYGIWYMSCMLYGIWCKVYGIWCMIHGIWYMVYGTWEGFRAGGGAFHKECLAHCQMEDRQLARILTELATLPRRICSPPCTLRALPRQTDTLSGAVQWKTDILACSSQKLVS